MGSKNRQGCCCGSSKAVACYNVADVCRGGAHAVLYVKNGRVEDDNGEWPLSPTIDTLDTTTEWTTQPIKFTTNRWTDGDCTPKNGDAYYHYRVGSGGTYCALMYSAQDCGAVTLYTGSKVATDQQFQTKGYAQIHCDPIGADYDFAEVSGLAPPSLKAKVTFEIDEEATRSCGCRGCRAANDYPSFSPLGDVTLTYKIDYPGVKKDGSVTLKKMDASSRTLHGPNGAVYLGVWNGNVDWWDQPSCSNPTNSKSLWNASYACTVPRFLRWCESTGGPTTTPYLNPKPYPTPGGIEYDLIDPGATPQKQGTITLVDDATGFDGVCCSPCVLPKKDIAVSFAGTGPGATSWSIALKFFENTKISSAGVLTNAFQWATEAPFSQVYDPFHPSPNQYPVYPGSSSFPPDPGIVIGKSYRYNMYLDCENLYFAWVQDDGVDFALNVVKHLDYIVDFRSNVSPFTFNQTEYTCEPFHFSNTAGLGGQGGVPFRQGVWRFDEIEP